MGHPNPFKKSSFRNEKCNLIRQRLQVNGNELKQDDTP